MHVQSSDSKTWGKLKNCLGKKKIKSPRNVRMKYNLNFVSYIVLNTGRIQVSYSY